MDIPIKSPHLEEMSAEERETVIDQRTQELASALSSAQLETGELTLAKQLEEIEMAREKEEVEERQKGTAASVTSPRASGSLTVRDGQFTYRNEHFRDLSQRDTRDKISGSFIMDGLTAQASTGALGSKPEVRKGENVVGKHPMDKPQETALSAVTCPPGLLCLF